MVSVSGILNIYKHEGFLKLRSKNYVYQKRNNFFINKIDGIIVGCVERKDIHLQTVELGALAIPTKSRNIRVGVVRLTHL